MIIHLTQHDKKKAVLFKIRRYICKLRQYGPKSPIYICKI